MERAEKIMQGAEKIMKLWVAEKIIGGGFNFRASYFTLIRWITR